MADAGWRVLAPFRFREYRLLIAAVSLSIFAEGRWAVVMTLQVIALDNDPPSLSLVAACLGAGLVSFVLVGGLAADRVSQRGIIIIVEAVNTVVVSAMAALGRVGALQIWHMAVVHHRVLRDGQCARRFGRLVPTAAAPVPDRDDGDVEHRLDPAGDRRRHLGVTSSFPLMAAATFIIGVTDGAGMVIWGTLLQRRVPPAMLGRVSSLDFFVSLAFMPVSFAIVGPLSKVISMETIFLAPGATPVLLAAVAVWAAKMRRDELTHPLR